MIDRNASSDWDIILRHLVSVAHTDVIVEWAGKRWFYTQPEHIQHGIFMLPQRAPKNTPVMNGAVILTGAFDHAA